MNTCANCRHWRPHAGAPTTGSAGSSASNGDNAAAPSSSTSCGRSLPTTHGTRHTARLRMLVVRGPAARAVPVTAIGESICAATGDRFAPEQVIDLCRNAHRTSRSEPRSHRLGTATSRQPRSRTGQAGDCELTLLAVHTPTPPTSRAWPATIPEALQDNWQDNWDDGFTLTDATDALAEHPDNQILGPQSRRRPSAGLLGAPDRRRPHRAARRRRVCRRRRADRRRSRVACSQPIGPDQQRRPSGPDGNAQAVACDGEESRPERDCGRGRRLSRTELSGPVQHLLTRAGR